jgi:alpha-glucosidase
VIEPDGKPGQYYLHLFDVHQPDLNWDNPEVFDDFAKSLRFWLDRGVDGFRIDVAHGMAKPPGLPDAKENVKVLSHSDDDPRFNHPSVHDIHRKIRKTVDEYPGAVTIGEVWVMDNLLWAEYLRPDELHLGFNFRLTKIDFDARQIHDAIENSLAATAIYDAVPTWTLSNHDVDREVTRYGGGEIGRRRARAMVMLMLALPGTVFIYNGEELGLPDVLDLPEEVLQDPTWERSGHTERGRDKCRVPIPWSGEAPPFGFSASADTWLPMPADWAALTVEKQEADADSMLSFFRRVLELRRARSELDGELVFLPAPPDAVIFRRSGGLVCALNAGKHPIALPDGEPVLASAPLVDGKLPPDSAVWLV